jgi:hypothetical protein
MLFLLVAQITQSWIRHRSEHHFSSTVKQAIMVATGSVSVERRNAALETSERFGITHIAERALTAMQITRCDPDDAPSPRHPADSPAEPESRKLNNVVHTAVTTKDR